MLVIYGDKPFLE